MTPTSTDRLPVITITAITTTSNISMIHTLLLGYEPADLTVHPPLPELLRVGSCFSYRCLVFPEKCPQMKACALRSYSG